MKMLPEEHRDEAIRLRRDAATAEGVWSATMMYEKAKLHQHIWEHEELVRGQKRGGGRTS